MVQYTEKTLALFNDALETKSPEKLVGQKVIGYGGSPAGQGPHIHLYIGIENQTIIDATFKTYGCPACIACSKAICNIVTGIEIEAAKQKETEDLKKLVGELPRAKQHCYKLALTALKDAITKIEKRI